MRRLVAVGVLALVLAGCGAAAQSPPTAPPGWSEVACKAIRYVATYQDAEGRANGPVFRELAMAYIDSLPEWDLGAPLEAGLRHMVAVAGELGDTSLAWSNTVTPAYRSLMLGHGLTCTGLDGDGVPLEPTS